MKTPLYLIFFIYSIQCFSQPVAPSSNVPASNAPSLSAITVFPNLTDYINTTNRNYVREFTPQSPTTNTANVEMVPSSSFTVESIVNTTYMDGLGRPLQDIKKCGALLQLDVVTPHVYDLAGRVSNEYLPFTVNDVIANKGRLKDDPLTQLSAQYNTLYYGEQPYNETRFDNSPLERPILKLPEGKAWVGSTKGTLLSYLTNSPSASRPFSYNVLRWTVGPNSTDMPATNGKYANNQLYIVETYDEDGQDAYVVKDKSGKLILEHRVEYGPNRTFFYYDTYYVYDEMQRLRWVITPQAMQNPPADFAAASSPSYIQDVLDGLCYKYVYDERGRVIEKKLPGKDVEYFIYDRYDRLVLSQDGVLRAGGGGVAAPAPLKWKFVTYDALSRPLSTGIYTAGTGTTRQSLATAVVNPSTPSSASSVLYYIENPGLFNKYPATTVSLTNGEVLTYSYLDDYQYAPSGTSFTSSYNAQLTGSAPYAVTPADCNHTRGLMTGSKIKIMDGSGTPHWINTTSFYDKAGRMVQQHSTNLHTNGINITTNQYDFSGTLISSVLHHENPDAISPDPATPGMHVNTDIVKKYTKLYNNGNIKTIEQNINGVGYRIISDNTYDWLGRIENKCQGGAVDNRFSYNIRNWLTGINLSTLDNNPIAGPHADYFHEQLCYNYGFASQLYNGNIAGIRWRGDGTQKRFYGYSYDQLSRLNHAEFGEATATSSSYSKTNVDLTASNITYDYNGNIQTMYQRGPGSSGPVDMDMMSYTYAPYSNRLAKVAESPYAATSALAPDFRDGSNTADDYEYDENGNLTKDLNKGITSAITYSYLDKPLHIDVNGKGSIDYTYDAAGTLLKKSVYDQAANTTTVTEYDGPFVYTDNKLQYILHEEGRCRPEPLAANGKAIYQYDYFVKDHLNNVRSVVNAQITGVGPIVRYHTGLEISLAKTEALIWDHLDDVRTTSPAPNGPNDTYAAELNGAIDSQRIGTALMLRVMPGDRFDVSAKSYYQAANQNNANTPQQFASSLLSALTGGSMYNNIPVAELPQNVMILQNTVGNPAFANAYDNLVNSNTDSLLPASHLNYIFFNEQFQMDASKSGAVQCGAATNQWNTVDINNTVEIAEPGYVLVFVGSKANSPVYWDQVDVTFYKGTVLEENHYYPFGLTLSTATTNPAEKNSYKLTTKELQPEFGLNVYNFGKRMHDMQTGRWWQIDSLADRYPSISPFSYVANMPTRAIDPDGKRIIFVNGYLGFGSPEGGQTYWNGANSSFVIGAQKYFHDNQSPYFTDIDHGTFSTADERYQHGWDYADKYYDLLTKDMDITNDKFEFVTHSMGAAEAAGMIAYLKQFGWNVSDLYAFNTFQAADVKVNKENSPLRLNDGMKTEVVDYQNTDDPVINNPFRSSPGAIQNTDYEIREESGRDFSYKHRTPIDGGAIWDRIGKLIQDQASGSW